MGINEKPGENHRSGFKESELKLMEKMFENAPVPMCILEGPDHRLQYINQSFRWLYGDSSFPPGTPAQDILMEVKDQEEARDRLEKLDHVYTTGEPFIANEFKTSYDRGGTGELEEGYFNLIFQPLKDAEGQVYGIIIVGYEVTDQVEARQEIAQHEQRLEIALEGARVGFWEVDAKDNTFDFISNQFKAHFGRSLEETFTYKDFLDALHPDDRTPVMDELKKAVDAGRFYEVEYRAVWPDESLHWILVRGQIIHNEQGHPIRRVGISIDITQHKQTEEQLKEAVRLRDEFLSIASHELKTPVTSMKTRAELFERQLWDAGNSTYARQAGKINNHIDQLSRLTGSLLDISRIQKGGIALDKQTFSMRDLIEKRVEMMQSISQHTIEVRGEAKNKIYGDWNRIGQVLTNLLENAIKYSPEANRIIVRYGEEQGKVVVSVVDFGVGISKEDQQKVFQRFFKGKGEKKDTYPGFGIGLYISLQIIERHGGGIWVEDNPEGGSVFSFSLPLAKGRS